MLVNLGVRGKEHNRYNKSEISQNILYFYSVHRIPNEATRHINVWEDPDQLKGFRARDEVLINAYACVKVMAISG
jgi:hypothetical protein